MAIKFQYNKTSLGELTKQLKIRKNALPTIKSKESALRSEVKRAKDSALAFRKELDTLIKPLKVLLAPMRKVGNMILTIFSCLILTTRQQ